MERQEAIETVRRELPARMWQRDKAKTTSRHPSYICPICGSGSGTHGTGITTKDGVHYTCWGGNCFTNEDVLQIVGLQYGLNDFNEQLKKCCELYGLSYEDLQADNSGGPIKGKAAASEPVKEEAEEQEDFTSFFIECAKHINETDYMQKRGLSNEVLKRFSIGYCMGWQHPSEVKKYIEGKRDKAPYQSNRIIIPTSAYSYLARDTRENLTQEQAKYSKQKAGSANLFNVNMLKRTKGYVFITEGEIDALSFFEIGYNAVALGSVKYINKLVSFLQENPTQATLILALDNDAAGTEANSKLGLELTALNVKHYTVNVYGTCKDANEILVKDREAFKASCEQALENIADLQRQAEEYAKQEQEKAEMAAEEAKANYIKDKSVKGLRASFDLELELNANMATISTGLGLLDDILNGGLQKGLYFIGGISSIGKTTFCMQIADNVATAGNDVLVFALEMSKHELIAKSVSRYTYLEDTNKYQTSVHAKTTNSILYGRHRDKYTTEEKDVIEAAKNRYFDEVAPHLYIREGVGSLGVKDIRQAIEEHISITGNKPLVIVDYLQILAPYDVRATDKQNIDKAVLELKRISRDAEIPIIAISSFNRESYSSAVTMASFKESGAVEYTSDVLLGLQYSGMDRLSTETEDAYKKRIVSLREIEATKGNAGKAQRIQVKVLKNRNGRKGSVDLNFIPAFNYVYEDNPFTEKEQPTAIKPMRI